MLKIHEGGIISKKKELQRGALAQMGNWLRGARRSALSPQRANAQTSEQDPDPPRCHPGEATTGHASHAAWQPEPKLAPKLSTGVGEHQKRAPSVRPAQLACRRSAERTGLLRQARHLVGRKRGLAQELRFAAGSTKHPGPPGSGTHKACFAQGLVRLRAGAAALPPPGEGRSWQALGEGGRGSWHGNGSPSSTHAASVNFEHLPERS